MLILPGYHRLWAHTSYSATLPLRIFLAAVGGGAVEGSVRWWARDHRAHHRYTDTDKDPYSVRKGLLYSHFGWMIMKQNPKRIGRVSKCWGICSPERSNADPDFYSDRYLRPQ